jgi:hypothetical protein
MGSYYLIGNEEDAANLQRPRNGNQGCATSSKMKMAQGFQQPLENEDTDQDIAQCVGQTVAGQTTMRGEGGHSPNSAGGAGGNGI